MKNLYYIYTISCLLIATQFADAQGIIIPAGSYLIQDEGNIVTTGNFTNNGSFTANGGTVVFAGTTQSIDGTATDIFNNITVESGSTTIITSSSQQIRGILKSDGTLNANGNLTLLSNATQTALIDGEGIGNVTGNLTIQRYLAAGNGYKYVSSPFTSATVNQFSDDLDLNEDFPTFYRYDENDDSYGWMIYTNSSGALNPVEGYAANFGSSTSAKTIDMTGEVNNGNMSAPTLYNHDKEYTMGFNLVGNPYPSPIDWEAPTGWTRLNLDDAIYFFNASEFQYTGYYSSYINGVSSDNIASNIIPAMQGFFVHVSDGSYPVSATFSMTNAVRVNTLNPVYHKNGPQERPLIRLVSRYTKDTMASDAMVVYFDEDATHGFDKQLDALKIMNTDERAPNLYANGDNKLSISSIPVPVDSIDAVPLGFESTTDNEVSFIATDIEYMPYGLQAYIADAKSLTVQKLLPGKEYRYELAAGKHEQFSIVFSKKELSNTYFTYRGLNAYNNGQQLMVTLNLATGSSGDFVVRNIMGQDVYKTPLNGYGHHAVELPNTAGIYLLSFYSPNGVFTKKIFLSKE